MSSLAMEPEFFEARDFSYCFPPDNHPGVLVDAVYENWQPTTVSEVFDTVYDLMQSVDVSPEHRQQLVEQMMGILLSESWWFRESFSGCEPSFDPFKFMAIPSQLFQMQLLDEDLRPSEVDCKWVFNFTDIPMKPEELGRLNKLMCILAGKAGENELNTLKNIVVIPHRNNLFIYMDSSKIVLAKGILSGDPYRIAGNEAVGRRGLDELFAKIADQYAGTSGRAIGAVALDSYRPTAPTLPRPINVRVHVTDAQV